MMHGTVAAVDSCRALRRDAIACAAAVAFGLVALELALAAVARLGVDFLLRSAVLFGASLALLVRYLPAHLPHQRFGAANAVTLARLALVVLLAALIGEELHAVGWPIVAIASVVLALDGVDGWAARRSGMESAFGARFDMETDSLLLLVLTLLAWQLQQAGAWIIAAGALRYLFVAAGWLWRWLERPLPPSRRRKTVCVVQIVAMIVCIAPPVQRQRVFKPAPEPVSYTHLTLPTTERV